MTDGPSGADTPDDYPWYRSINDGSLEQGDILFRFPSVSVVSTYEQLLAGEIDFDIKYHNVIVLTQSCDLSASKIDNVLLCPVFPLSKLTEQFPELEKSKGLKSVQQGRIISLYLLPPCDIEPLVGDWQLVNFRQVLIAPFHVVEAHAGSQHNRARLCPPYREHLSQAFARFIMRIGLPKDFLH